MKVYGKLESAQVEHLDADPTNLPLGRVWHNKTSNKTKIRQNAATENLSTETYVDAAKSSVESQLAAHEADTSTHGVTTVAGLDEAQIFNNKTYNNAQFTGTPTGLTKAHVGLDQVDNTSDATKNAAVAVLNNKTLTSPVINDQQSNLIDFTHQIGAITPPAAGRSKIYYKSDGKLYEQNASGVETRLGAGTGGGDVNYITDGDAEGLNPFVVSKNTVASARPDVGFVTSATTLVVGNVGIDPLNGSYSFHVIKSAVNTQGQQAYIDFDIPEKSKAKVLDIRVNYKVLSGTFSAGSSTTDSDLIVYIAALNPNTAQWEMIEPSSFKLLSNSTTISDEFRASFQTTATATAYRLILHVASTNASAWTLQVDDIAVSPSRYVCGTPITDWQTFTPTGSWTSNVTYTGRWRRVGDSLQQQVRIACGGAPNVGNLTVNLKSGLTIDTTKLVSNTSGGNYIKGTASILDGGLQILGADLIYNTQTSIYVDVTNTGSTYGTFSNVSSTVPFTFGPGDAVDLEFEVPILGWSSSVQMSDSADTRVVAFFGSKSTSQAATAHVTDITYTAVIDTHSAWTGSAYRVPSRGIYNLEWNGDTSSGTGIYVYVNGVQSIYLSNSYPTQVLSGVKKLALNSGDLVSIRPGGSVTVSGTVTTGLYSFGIERISGPSAIAATETISARYTNIAGTAIGTSPVLVPFPTFSYDSHGCYNTTTGLFTVQASGKYRVTAKLTSASVTLSTVQAFNLHLWKNGANYSELNATIGNGVASNYRVAGTDEVQCVAGDTIAIYANCSVATSLFGISGYNYLVIERVGN